MPLHFLNACEKKLVSSNPQLSATSRIMMCGSSIAAILTILFGVHDPAPHGGFLVLPVVDGWYLWLIAIFAGVLVGGILYVIFKRNEYHKNGDKVVE